MVNRIQDFFSSLKNKIDITEPVERLQQAGRDFKEVFIDPTISAYNTAFPKGREMSLPTNDPMVASFQKLGMSGDEAIKAKSNMENAALGVVGSLKAVKPLFHGTNAPMSKILKEGLRLDKSNMETQISGSGNPGIFSSYDRNYSKDFGKNIVKIDTSKMNILEVNTPEWKRVVDILDEAGERGEDMTELAKQFRKQGIDGVKGYADADILFFRDIKPNELSKGKAQIGPMSILGGLGAIGATGAAVGTNFGKGIQKGMKILKSQAEKDLKDLFVPDSTKLFIDRPESKNPLPYMKDIDETKAKDITATIYGETGYGDLHKDEKEIQAMFNVLVNRSKLGENRDRNKDLATIITTPGQFLAQTGRLHKEYLDDNIPSGYKERAQLVQKYMDMLLRGEEIPDITNGAIYFDKLERPGSIKYGVHYFRSKY